MIGKAYKAGRGFKGLAAYLQHGREGVQRDRIDWIESRNLPTRDPQAAARIMAATARDSESIQPPVYHFSISFDPNDPVNRETMRQVVDRLLRDLGLQDHQALIIAHRDRAHPHVHVIVNRVHPKTHRVWSNSWDYPRIERSMRAQEMELGLRVVRSPHAPVPEHVGAPATAERLMRGDAAFLERVRREAGPHLTGARSWGELERDLAGHGLSVRVEGRGLVVTDGVQKVKGSEIDRAASRASVECRLGSLGEYRARQAVAARTLDERAARAGQHQVQDGTAPTREAVAPVAPVPDVAPVACVPEPEPEAASAPVQDQPPAVHRPTKSSPSLAEARPQRPPRARRSVPVSRVDGHAPPVSHPSYYAGPREVQMAAALIREASTAVRLAAAVIDAEDAERAAATAFARLKRREKDATDAGSALQAAVERVYAIRKWEEVANRIEAHRQEHGAAATARVLAKAPERFGPLQTEYPAWGRGFVWSRSRARLRAPGLLHRVEDLMESREARPTPEQLEAARGAAADAARAAIGARRERGMLLPRETYEQQAAGVLVHLVAERGAAWVRWQLTLALPPEDREAMEIVTQVLRLAEAELAPRLRLGRSEGQGGWSL